MKKSMWFVLAVTVLYAAMQVVSHVTQVQQADMFRWYTTVLSIGRAWLAPACVAVYILRGNKAKSLWMTAATAVLVLSNVIALVSMIRTIAAVYASVTLWVMLLHNMLLFAAAVLMLVGTFSDFRFASCLQVGAFASAALTLLYVFVSWWLAGGKSYYESVPADVAAVNVVALCSLVVTALFYAGLGVLAVEKKREKQSVEPLS